MRTWLKRTLIGAFGASLLIGGIAACGHRHHDRRAMTEEDVAQLSQRVVDRVQRKLDLDEAQKAKLVLLAGKLREQRSTMVAGGTARERFATMIGGTSFDRASARRWVDEKSAVVQGGAPQLIDTLADFYDSLRPEQQARVRELLASGRRGWHRG